MSEFAERSAGITEVLRTVRGPAHDTSAGRGGKALLEALDAVLHGRREAVYVSTPITTGPEFVRWWRVKGSVRASDKSAYARALGDIVDHNIAAVRPLVQRVEKHFDVPVIDPTRLDSIPGWTQPDYHRFWLAVIDRFVSALVFAEGWSLSSGCALEYAAAVRAGRSTFDSSISPLLVSVGSRALGEAVEELEHAGLDASAQRSALVTLSKARDAHDLSVGAKASRDASG